MRILGNYLSVSEIPDDDLSNLEDLKTPGSCRWYVESHNFQEWLNPLSNQTRFCWLSAKPAAGKSILAAHVATHLKELGLDCCYYFFKHGSKTKQVSSGLLRSLAFQLAFLSVNIRQALL